MNYIPFDSYAKGWIFRHRELSIPEETLSLIKPMTERRSEQLWFEFISRHCDHPEFIASPDWAADDQAWKETASWQGAWDSQSDDLPELLSEHLQDWEPDTTVYFCYEASHVIETKWSVFKKHWKNFLFMDNGPLLIGKKRKQAVQFFENGNFRIGQRDKK